MPKDDRGLEKIAAKSGEITPADKKKLSIHKERGLSPIELLGKKLNIPGRQFTSARRRARFPAL